MRATLVAATFTALVALAVACASLGSPAAAHHNGRPSLDPYLEPDGTAVLIANPSGHAVAWERCPPDGSGCVPHDDGDGDPQTLRVADERPGTVFAAIQDGTRVQTAAWRGRVRAIAPPRVEGELRVGAVVRPVAGMWEGGWGRETSWLQLQACRTAEGAGCVVIVDEIKFGRCRDGGGRVLAARHAGHFVRVVDRRIDIKQPFTREGYGRPEGVTPNVPNELAVVGAVAGPVGSGPAPTEDCGGDPLPPPATVRLPRSANRSSAAVVTCPRRCRLVLTARQGDRLRTVRRVLSAGRTRVGLPRGLRFGVVTLRARIDGKLVATRRLCVP